MPVTTLNDTLDRLATLVDDQKTEGGEPSIQITASEASLLIAYVEALEEKNDS